MSGEKRVNELRIKQLKAQLLSTEEYSDLVTIAGQCFDRSSNAIYQAYSMLKEEDRQNQFSDFPLPCANLQENEIKTRLKEQVAVSVFPNPSSGTLSLHGLDNISSLTLVNMNGNHEESIPIHKKSITLDISHLSDGIYFLKLIELNGNQIIKKFVLNKW
ncbi:MAG: T9SS type A sorting domain-containing protein [Saprospiraceae bacterium]